MKSRPIATFIVILSTILLTACSQVTLDVKRGTATVRSFGVSRKLKEIEIKQGTNSFRILGFESDQVQAIRLGIEAALKAAKP